MLPTSTAKDGDQNKENLYGLGNSRLLDCSYPCPFCGNRWQKIEVHGHKQCPNCLINIEPCCEGTPLRLDLNASKY